MVVVDGRHRRAVETDVEFSHGFPFEVGDVVVRAVLVDEMVGERERIGRRLHVSVSS
jgi:predicted thioesterase